MAEKAGEILTAVPVPTSPKFEPFIRPETVLREFTVRALITGTVLGVMFGASSLYLVLKVGLTVSASIPVAVISLALFRGLSKLGFRDATILENNVSQTAGSAGESIAFGVGVTMPAIMILGFDLELPRVLLVSVMGGLLGILMMIPLRRALIVKEHGSLKYPEGTACAAVLTAGASAADRLQASPSAVAEMRAAEAAGLGKAPGARSIFTGLGIGMAYNVLNRAFRLWKDTPEKIFGEPFKGASVSAEISPELLGVGYIIGPRIGALMCGGGILSYLVLIPMIKFFGEHLNGPLAPGRIPVADMDPDQVREAYILYIGSGAVAAGGIISLFRSLPTIWRGLREGFRDVGFLNRGSDGGGKGSAPSGAPVPRTDQDLPMKVVGIGIILLIAGIMAAPMLLDAGWGAKLAGALLIIVFGFLFVTVSSRLTGEIGSSSNPISGMTIATVLLTCLIFLIVGWTGGAYYVTALSVGAIVCIAASNGGSTSQDLKTGFLLGATPKYLQIAILFGSFASAVVLGPILLVLNQSKTVYVPVSEVAPAGLSTDVSLLTGRESLHGVQARGDSTLYHVWHKSDPAGGAAEKYLVDDSGRAVWLVDPGINGSHSHRPDGSEVEKFHAPKATLISYIIKGILGHRLPWSLVLLGVMIALTLEMSGVPSLAFAVGVYLPLSSSSPIWIGGLIRWLVDVQQRRRHHGKDLSEEQLVAEGDRSPGVLLSSGYIAGGAIAGIGLAVLAGVPGVLSDTDAKLERWASASNPAFNGAYADFLSLIPFALLTLFLYLVGREKLLSPAQNVISAMPDERAQILARVREALAPLKERVPLPEYEGGLAVMRKLLADRDPVTVFAERLKLLNGEALFGGGALAERLRAGGWTHGYCDPALWPALQSSLGEGFTVEQEFERARVDDYQFGITRAAGAIAETGTIILNDATTSRRLAALTPWTHVAVIPRSCVYSDLAQAVGLLGDDPNVIWCTGPSRTADVEGILIQGVHGPGVQIGLILD